MSTSIKGAVVVITGANGGLGQEFVAQALERGATKVYATARSPREWDDPRVVALPLDVTDQQSIDAVALAAADATLVINNAGIGLANNSLTTGLSADIRQMFDTNFFGAIEVARAFAPILGANGGGALIDVHSVLSWVGVGGSYSAAKAAFWSATNSFRIELAPQGTHVLGLHMGWVDTPMAAAVDVPKLDPADVVRAGYDGLESGVYEVVVDDFTAQVKQLLSGSIEDLYTDLPRR